MSVISLMFKEKWLLQKHFRKIIFGIFLLLPLGYFLLLENNVTDIHIVHLVERVMFEKKMCLHGSISSRQIIEQPQNKTGVNFISAITSTMTVISLIT